MMMFFAKTPPPPRSVSKEEDEERGGGGGGSRFPFRCVATRSFTTSSSLSDDERRDDDECKEDEKGLLAGGASIYSKPDVYALAFGTFRDFPKEVDFLHKLYEILLRKEVANALGARMRSGVALHRTREESTQRR